MSEYATSPYGACEEQWSLSQDQTLAQNFPYKYLSQLELTKYSVFSQSSMTMAVLNLWFDCVFISQRGRCACLLMLMHHRYYGQVAKQTMQHPHVTFGPTPHTVRTRTDLRVVVPRAHGGDAVVLAQVLAHRRLVHAVLGEHWGALVAPHVDGHGRVVLRRARRRTQIRRAHDDLRSANILGGVTRQIVNSVFYLCLSRQNAKEKCVDQQVCLHFWHIDTLDHFTGQNERKLVFERQLSYPVDFRHGRLELHRFPLEDFSSRAVDDEVLLRERVANDRVANLVVRFLQKTESFLLHVV